MPGQTSYKMAGSGQQCTASSTNHADSGGGRSYVTRTSLLADYAKTKVQRVDFERDLDKEVPPSIIRQEVKNSLEVEIEQQDAVPDSTTAEKHAYNCGHDVLVENKDGRFYLGTVVEVGDTSCLVKFGDGTRTWWPTRCLRPLRAAPADDNRAMCVVCKRREGALAAPVLACDVCGRGYHAACHTPPVQERIAGASWHCRRCVDQRYRVAVAENRALRKAELLKMRGQQHSRAFAIMAELEDGTDASDDVSSIASDVQSRGRCYCGLKNDWLAQMLMCCRCMRWFHQKCVLSLRYPLYAGDKFYVFLCRFCNGGCEEYLRRVELRWMDLAHLALYNLSSYSSRKYFDLHNVIMPYIIDNWAALQLPEKMLSMSPVDRRERVATALTASRSRFKNGREIKKRATLWGLRASRPPPPPLHLEPLLRQASAGTLTVPLTDEVVSQIAPRLKLLPRTKTPSPCIIDDDCSQPSSSNTGSSSFISFSSYGTCHSPNSLYNGDTKASMIIPIDNHWLAIMMGKRFHDDNSCSDDSRSTSPSFPAGANNATFGPRNNDFILRINNERGTSPYTFEDDLLEMEPAKPTKPKQLKLYEMDFQGGGFVKKSMPFPPLSPLKQKKIATLKKRSPNEEHLSENAPRTRKLLRNTLSKQLRVMVDNIGQNLQLDSPHLESLSSDSSDKVVLSKMAEASLSLTPPTSVSAPPTPPANSTSASSESLNVLKIESKNDYDSDHDANDFVLCQGSDAKKSDLYSCKVHLSKMRMEDLPKSNLFGDTLYSGMHTSKIATMNLEICKLSTKSVIEHSKIMSLHYGNSLEPFSKNLYVNHEHDSSGDETSSRGTLDAIIPHPKDFHGKNNPFFALGKGCTDRKSGSSLASKLFIKNKNQKNGVVVVPKAAVSVAAVAPPMRPLKRQLSEKDLVIGPNGEVKRRRHRRPTRSSQLPLQADQGDSPQQDQRSRTSSFDEQKSPQADSTVALSADSNLNGRRLRQRQEKNYFENGRRSSGQNAVAPLAVPSVHLNNNSVKSLHLSPSKNNPTCKDAEGICFSQLKSSISDYFGASNRILAGEKFSVVAKRIAETGRAQYLIEFDGHNS